MTRSTAMGRRKDHYCNLEDDSPCKTVANGNVKLHLLKWWMFWNFCTKKLYNMFHVIIIINLCDYKHIYLLRSYLGSIFSDFFKKCVFTFVCPTGSPVFSGVHTCAHNSDRLFTNVCHFSPIRTPFDTVRGSISIK